MSRRIIDSRGEKALSIFLDTYFYPKAREKRIITYYERVYNKEYQVKGIDILLDDRRIDEKGQLYYINHPVDSFAFEIDYFEEEKNKIVDGWFINEANTTDEYLLMWIKKARTNQINRIVSEDFEIVNADLIRKIDLKDYLNDLKLSDNCLKEAAKEIRNNQIERKKFNDTCHLTYSMKGFSEMPINLVIKKEILDSISIKRFEINKDEIKEV